MIRLRVRACFFRFTAYTQSHVCTERWKCVYRVCGVTVCVAYFGQEKQSDTLRLPSSATDAYVWPACGHKAVFAEALV